MALHKSGRRLMTLSAALQRLPELRDAELRRLLLRRTSERMRARRHGLSGARVASGVRLSGSGRLDLQTGSRIKEQARVFVADGAVLVLGVGASIGIRNVVNVAELVTI